MFANSQDLGCLLDMDMMMTLVIQWMNERRPPGQAVLKWGMVISNKQTIRCEFFTYPFGNVASHVDRHSYIHTNRKADKLNIRQLNEEFLGARGIDACFANRQTVMSKFTTFCKSWFVSPFIFWLFYLQLTNVINIFVYFCSKRQKGKSGTKKPSWRTNIRNSHDILMGKMKQFLCVFFFLAVWLFLIVMHCKSAGVSRLNFLNQIQLNAFRPIV